MHVFVLLYQNFIFLYTLKLSLSSTMSKFCTDYFFEKKTVIFRVDNRSQSRTGETLGAYRQKITFCLFHFQFFISHLAGATQCYLFMEYFDVFFFCICSSQCINWNNFQAIFFSIWGATVFKIAHSRSYGVSSRFTRQGLFYNNIFDGLFVDSPRPKYDEKFVYHTNFKMCFVRE